MAKLNSDETIRDVLYRLKDPAGYVLGVLRNMDRLRQAGIVTLVSIGLTGRAVAPNYRFDPCDAADHKAMVAQFAASEIAFNGLNHRLMDFAFVDNGSWSLAPMTLDEVKNLIGEVRGVLK